MKVKLALAIVGALVICLLPGCRDFIMEEYQEARAERAEAQAQVADLQAELEAVQATVTEIQRELETSQARITELETELETSQAGITELETELENGQAGIATSEETPPTVESTPLQEENLRYREYEGRLVTVHMAILDATWNNDKLTVSWELTNKANRKIHLDYLGVKARDQMWIKGEWKVEEEEFSEEPRKIYPTLQEDVETPWPGEKLQFETVWKFGPLSEKITIVFVVYDKDGEIEEEDEYNLPEFTLVH